MTDLALIARKLATVSLRTTRARVKRPVDAAEFATDLDAQDVVSLSLFVAMQEALDIAFHVATDAGFGMPASNAEAFELLATRGVIPGDLARDLVGLATLRNRIAHGYASLDHARLWQELPAGLDALDAFAAQIALFVGRA